jgi:hypothetical protein
MTQGITKERLLMKLNGEHRYLLSLLRDVPQEQRELPGKLEAWSLKDLFAHLLAREQFLLVYLELLKGDHAYKPSTNQAELQTFQDIHGVPDFGSPQLTDEQSAAWAISRSQQATWDDLSRLEAEVVTRLVAEIDSLSRAELESEGVDRAIASNTWEHYDQHLADLQALQD